jgi:tetratricopeptide (TPR) repeat protein
MALYATREDHTSAAQSIYSEKLLSVLTPSGKFELAESLIRALLRPDLPMITLANLYLELANCCWQQNKLSEAEKYALWVQEIGERIDDSLLALRAQQHLITIYSKGGQLAKAHELIELCRSHPAIEVDPQIHARILFDNSNNLGHAGASIELICDSRKRARDILERSGHFTTMHETLSELGLAFFFLDWGQLDEASQACLRAQACASRIDFKQGLCFAKLIEADLCSRQGKHHHALKLFRDFYPGIQFGDTGLYEAMGAGILRREGRCEEALKMAQIGLGSHNEVFQAHCSLELAHTYAEMGLLENARQYLLHTKASYEKVGAFGRARRIKEVPLFNSDGIHQNKPLARPELQLLVQS